MHIVDHARDCHPWFDNSILLHRMSTQLTAMVKTTLTTRHLEVKLVFKGDEFTGNVTPNLIAIARRANEATGLLSQVARTLHAPQPPPAASVIRRTPVKAASVVGLFPSSTEVGIATNADNLPLHVGYLPPLPWYACLTCVGHFPSLQDGALDETEAASGGRRNSLFGRLQSLRTSSLSRTPLDRPVTNPSLASSSAPGSSSNQSATARRKSFAAGLLTRGQSAGHNDAAAGTAAAPQRRHSLSATAGVGRLEEGRPSSLINPHAVFLDPVAVQTDRRQRVARSLELALFVGVDRLALATSSRFTTAEASLSNLTIVSEVRKHEHTTPGLFLELLHNSSPAYFIHVGPHPL